MNIRRIRLVEGVGAGSPVGEEEGETDGLHDAGDGTDGDGIERALLGDDLGDDLRGMLGNARVITFWLGARTEGAALAKKIKEPR